MLIDARGNDGNILLLVLVITELWSTQNARLLTALTGLLSGFWVS